MTASPAAAAINGNPTDADILRFITTARDDYPDLSPNGFLIVSDRPPRDGGSWQERHAESRATMADPERIAEFRVAWAFLSGDGGPLLTEQVNKRGTTYWWKHAAELWVRDREPSWPAKVYCSNGIFIAAALAAGCRIERTAPDNPNAFINLSARMSFTLDRHGDRRWRDRRSARRSVGG